jgi:hypothetical protein
VQRSLASNLASCAQGVVVWGCFRRPSTFAHRALDCGKGISKDVTVELPDKEEMNLDQYGRPDHQLPQQFKPFAPHLRKQLTSSRFFVLTS